MHALARAHSKIQDMLEEREARACARVVGGAGVLLGRGEREQPAGSASPAAVAGAGERVAAP